MESLTLEVTLCMATPVFVAGVMMSHEDVNCEPINILQIKIRTKLRTYTSFFRIREAQLYPFREISLSLGKPISILPSAGRILETMSSKV